jgi:hypothetical protein
MLFFRVFAQLLIAAALILLGTDALLSLEQGDIRMRTLSDLSELMSFGNLTAMLNASHELADGPKNLFLAIVGTPAWAVLGAVGIVLAWIFADRG